MKTVYFFVGPEKTGTTSIFDMLPQNENVRQKETFYLSHLMSSEKELSRIENTLADRVVIVEPSYYASPFALEVIAMFQEKFNIIVISTHRDALKRSISHYLHHKLKGRIKNVDEGIKKYPEIIKASNYEYFDALWEAQIKSYLVWDIDSVNFSLEKHLKSIGIENTSLDRVSNTRFSPRFILLSKLSTKMWDIMIRFGFNRLVPIYLKNFFKGVVYYGGPRPELTVVELDDISIHLNNEINHD